MQTTQDRLQVNRTPRRAPGPKGLPILGNFFEMRHISSLENMLALREEYGDILRMDTGPFTVHIINDPDMVQHVLQDNNRNYVKGYALSKSENLLGKGLLTNEGEAWRSQRRLIQPAFHRQVLDNFARVMTDSTAEMLADWAARPAGQPFNVSTDFLGLTLEIVGRTLYSTSVNEADKRTVGRVMPFILEETNRRISNIIDIGEKLPTAANRQLKRYIAELDAIVYGMIEQRRHSGEQLPDLLGMLLGAQDEDTGEGMNDKQLRDEVMTLFLAGHETTANNLSWTIYLLAEHPEVYAKVKAEVDQVLGGRTPSADDYRGLTYTRMVLDESLRLLPPAWAFGREPLEDDIVGGYSMPAGSSVIISPYVMHRHPDYWPEPEAFKPERFDPSVDSKRPKYAYLPFGGGPRQCIGNSFAQMEAVLVLAMLAQRYDFHTGPRPPGGTRADLHPALARRGLDPHPGTLIKARFGGLFLAG